MATPSSLHQAAWAHILSMSTAPLPIGHPRPPVSPSAHLQPPVYGCVQMASMLSRPLCSTDIATQLLEAQGLSGNASPGICPSQVSIPWPLPCSYPRLFPSQRGSRSVLLHLPHTHLVVCVCSLRTCVKAAPPARKSSLPLLFLPGNFKSFSGH